MKYGKILLITLLSLFVVFAGCTTKSDTNVNNSDTLNTSLNDSTVSNIVNNSTNNVNESVDTTIILENRSMTIITTNLPVEIVKGEIVKQILENNGYTVSISQMSTDDMYSTVYSGDADIMLSGSYPTTDSSFAGKYSNNLSKVKENVEDSWIGLAVNKNAYDNGVKSIDDLKNHSEMFDNTIVCLEENTGVAENTKSALTTYGLSNYTIKYVNPKELYALVDEANANNEDIVFVAWEPSALFEKYPVEKLADNEHIYAGKYDKITTVSRPEMYVWDYEAYRFLKEFQVSKDVANSWAVEYVYENKSAEEIASKWIDANQYEVDEWNELLK
ncbi:glycine betaine ABC transporter substrate-binding protein [Methanococcus voltae]|uniref:Substrate-binding region of ABC-type glycine betaine transport system n=1 Tax=Methanococcus voltae (strain ATCC BAA-1334 / A3) TaxID=456320 RepID=D7DSI5_METV3|nr:glycine betaine ABC transporter substrate-binding protein [Methanococcus voltae]MCS3901996.1 glycine betaine/proline transport system substrate-binding protein [Methanococcus voltae]